MNLDTYMINHKIGNPQGAKELGITRQHMWEIRTGIAFPGYILVQKIEKWSNHNVSFQDFKRPLDKGKARI
jgi:hypothetical protein